MNFLEENSLNELRSKICNPIFQWIFSSIRLLSLLCAVYLTCGGQGEWMAAKTGFFGWCLLHSAAETELYSNLSMQGTIVKANACLRSLANVVQPLFGCMSLCKRSILRGALTREQSVNGIRFIRNIPATGNRANDVWANKRQAFGERLKVIYMVLLSWEKYLFGNWTKFINFSLTHSAADDSRWHAAIYQIFSSNNVFVEVYLINSCKIFIIIIIRTNFSSPVTLHSSIVSRKIYSHCKKLWIV